VNSYKIELIETYNKESEAKSILGAKLLLSDQGNNYYLYPEQNLYKYEGNRNINKETEVAIYNTFKKDYYIILIDDMGNGRFNFKIYVNPWVSLLWIGSLISILGGVLIVFRRKS
jgi:cytochrome c biogenesis factor